MSRYLSALLLMILSHALSGQGFKTDQQKASRVKAAYADTWPELSKSLEDAGIGSSGFHMFIRVFKEEQRTEVWLKPRGKTQYQLFRTYDICASSGEPGPKRKQGDMQVPEGFYHISVFNPYSSYHLSLGISYPNASDRKIGKSNLGGDIMIHGSCVTIGCIPLTDKYIKEVYVLAVEARNNGQAKIPVHLFPCKPGSQNFAHLLQEYSSRKDLIAFWENIRKGYDHFESYKIPPTAGVNADGSYSFR